MSEEGDAGQWRPASSNTGPHAEPDEPTGPLPVVAGEDAAAPGFPPVTGGFETGSADDAQTDGFPSVSPAVGGASGASRERAPFEPPDSQTEPESSSEKPSFGPLSSSGSEDSSDWRSMLEDASRALSEFRSAGGSSESRRPAEDDDSEPSSSWRSEISESLSTDWRPAAENGSEASPSFGSEASSSFGSEASEMPETPESLPADRLRAAEDGSRDETPSSFTWPSVAERPEEPAARPSDRADADAGFGAEAPGADPYDVAAPGTSETSAAPAAPGGAAPRGVSDEDQAAENDFFGSADDAAAWNRPLTPSGPPPQPGKPSSGNLRLPDWMREENAARAAGQAVGGDDGFPDEGRSRLPLYTGLGILVAGLLVAAGVYFLKGGGDTPRPVANAVVPTRSAHKTQAAAPPPEKTLARFHGTHTKPVGRVVDRHAGLSYPRLGRPWEPAAKRSVMTELGFSASQFVVTEKAGGMPTHWGRLMSARLGGAERNVYDGPGTERAAATELADVYEARMYGFRHKTKPMASQPLNIDGHKGWLVAHYLTYHRAGTKATGDLFAVALVDTGRKLPGVLVMSVPNTHRKLWPDVNYVMDALRVT